MGLPKDFVFPGPDALRVEAERRAVVMFGADWREDCCVSNDRYGRHAIALNDTMLTFTSRHISTLVNGTSQDLLDGTPSEIEYYPDGVAHIVCHFRNGRADSPADGIPASVTYYHNGAIRHVVHMKNGERIDPADGTPCEVSYNRDGIITGGASSVNGALSDKETAKLLDIAKKAKQVCRVAELLAKADQDVIPAGMPLPADYGRAFPETNTKGGR